MEDIVAIIVIFGSVVVVMLAISPIGRAIADRIRGAGDAGRAKALEELKDSQLVLLEELDALRRELTDLHERLDFTERMLTKHRDVGRLPEAGSADESSRARPSRSKDVTA